MIVLNKKLTIQRHSHKTLGEFGKVVVMSKQLEPFVGKTLKMKIEIEEVTT